MLEKHLDVPFFDRGHRGVRLNGRGQAYLKEVQRILAEVHGVSERQRRWPRRVRIISVEAVAEKWLVPRLATFKAAHRGVAIEMESNHRGLDPDGRDFDAWFAYTGETAAPRPVSRREDTLYEEDLLPVCSPARMAARGRPRTPAELGGWPLLYDLGWDDRQAEAPERCCLITTAAARQRPEVRAFREWVLDDARNAALIAPDPVPQQS